MADTYYARRESLVEFRDRLKYVEGTTGLAVALGGKVISVDLFDKPVTCRKVWDRLLTGFVMDALEGGTDGERPGEGAVREKLIAFRDAPWRPTQAAAAGEEFRAEWDGNQFASALTCDGAVLHGSLIAG
jgi:hypothetical protein